MAGISSRLEWCAARSKRSALPFPSWMVWGSVGLFSDIKAKKLPQSCSFGPSVYGLVLQDTTSLDQVVSLLEQCQSTLREPLAFLVVGVPPLLPEWKDLLQGRNRSRRLLDSVVLQQQFGRFEMFKSADYEGLESDAQWIMVLRSFAPEGCWQDRASLFVCSSFAVLNLKIKGYKVSCLTLFNGTKFTRWQVKW